jgi:hypothetical protein
MKKQHNTPAKLAFLLGWLAAWPVLAGGKVELELVADAHAPIEGQQEWLRQLGAAGVTDLRIRARTSADKFGVEVRGGQPSPTYAVTGLLDSHSEVIIPTAGRFKAADAGKLARWLQDLAQRGPGGKTQQRAAFGLTPEQFDHAKTDLSQPVAFATQGMPRLQAIQKIAGQLTGKLTVAPDALKSEETDNVAEDLSPLSCGTALACLLRPLGLSLVPSAAGGQVSYAAIAVKRGADAWPVGWPSDKPLPATLPAMYESFNANLENVPVSKVLNAVGPRLKTPILIDHNALAFRKIDLDKKTVVVPKQRTTYATLLRKVLSPELKSEVRVDEAGTPFLWVTTAKPF